MAAECAGGRCGRLGCRCAGRVRRGGTRRGGLRTGGPRIGVYWAGGPCVPAGAGPAGQALCLEVPGQASVPSHRARLSGRGSSKPTGGPGAGAAKDRGRGASEVQPLREGPRHPERGGLRPGRAEDAVPDPRSGRRVSRLPAPLRFAVPPPSAPCGPASPARSLPRRLWNVLDYRCLWQFCASCCFERLHTLGSELRSRRISHSRRPR